MPIYSNNYKIQLASFNERHEGFYVAFVDSTADIEIARHAPIDPPAVAADPVVQTLVRRAVAYEDDGVIVHGCRWLVTSTIIVNSVPEDYYTVLTKPFHEIFRSLKINK